MIQHITQKKYVHPWHPCGIIKIGMRRNPAVFEMQAFEIKCEDCPHLNDPIQSEKIVVSYSD